MPPFDINGTDVQVFWRGVLKGMAAPCGLYRPLQVPEVPQVAVVVPFTMSAAEALTADSQRVQADIIKALRLFGQS